MTQAIDDMLASLQRGDAIPVRQVARLLSQVESDAAAAQRVLAQPRPSGTLLGITGPPGSGKSTLTDAILGTLRSQHSHRRMGVVAVDPSSPRSGGAILGDRVRMMRHADDPLIYIRSMATRGHLGGLAQHSLAVARVLQWMKCDPVILETVGVGQNEVEVAGVAEKVMLVLCPGGGDSVQLLKSGIMEIGDIIVINKSDQPGADELEQALSSTLAMQHRDVPVLRVSALNQTGIDSLLKCLNLATEQGHGG